MATRLDPGQIQIRGVGGVPMQQVGVPQVDVTMAARGEAQYAGTLAQVLDRMSEGLFREAAQMRQAEGLEFVANNPITPQQLQAAKEGITWELGGRENLAGLRRTGNVYDEAVRKARSFELASHFEMEGKNDLVKMLADVKANKATGEEINQKIAAITNGYGMSLAKIDPDAALKFRATMATHGNTVLNAAYEEQLKREQSVRRIKVDQYFDNSQRLMFAEAMQDPDTFLQRADVHRKNVTDAAMLLGDVVAQREYSTKIQNAIMAAQVNAITTKLMDDDRYFQDTTRTIRALRSGAMLFDDKFTPMMNAIKTLDPVATNEIIKNFRAEVSARIAKRDDDAKIDRQNRETEAQNAMAVYFDPATPASQKNDLARAIVGTRTLSVEQVEKFLDPQARPGDKYAFAALQTAIDMGQVPDFQELLRQSNRAGMNGDQFVQLNKQLIDRSEKDQTEARQFIRRASGVPDVQSAFASKDDQFKIDKNEAILQRFNSMLVDFRQQNPGQRIPYTDLSRRAVDDYNNTERADKNKDRSRNAIAGSVADLIKEKKLPPGFTVDENTNLDDLATRYGKLRPEDIDYLQRHQRILRGVSR